jgi:hypothetical protein
MASQQEATEKLFDIWMNDEGVSEEVVRERAKKLRDEIRAELPEELYGNVLRGAYDMLCVYRQAKAEIDDITSEGFDDQGQQ